MNQKPSALPLIIQYARPWTLLAGTLFYTLGIGFVKYLGHSLLWDRLWIGLGMIMLLQVSSYLLKAHFDLIEASSPLYKTQKDLQEDDQQALSSIPRQGLLVLSITTLTAGAFLTVIMAAEGALNLPTLFILGIAFLLAFFYAVPPLRLVYSGYGELSEAVLIASLVPAFAFLLQMGELHRFLLVFSFPFIALYMAMRIALSLQSYSRQLKMGHKTLLIALGWQRAMRFHNILIPAGYFLLLLGALLGIPWSLTWPGLLTLPLGIFQMWQINQISSGSKPGWLLLRLTAGSLTGVTTYLVILALLTG